MADKKEEGKKEDDERLEYIYRYLVLSRKVKADKWLKMLGNEEFKDTILRFFETPEETILTVQLSPAGVLTPFLGIPATMRAKTSYFVKRSPVEVTRENYRDVVVPGDMAPKPIEELSVLVEEVYVPILSNPRNHKGWPCVVGEDVKKHVYDLRSVLCQLKGNMTGQTLLPMPMGIERIFEEELRVQQSGGAEVDLRLRSDTEAIVMKWCSQIGDTLHEESTRVFVTDERPQPSAGTVSPRVVTRILALGKMVSQSQRKLCRCEKLAKLDKFLANTAISHLYCVRSM